MIPDTRDRDGSHLRLVQQHFRAPSFASIPPAYHVVRCEARPHGVVVLGYRYVRPDSLPATDGVRVSRLFSRLGAEESYTDMGALSDQRDYRFRDLLTGMP
jgi:hypothetical protein